MSKATVLTTLQAKIAQRIRLIKRQIGPEQSHLKQQLVYESVAQAATDVSRIAYHHAHAIRYVKSQPKSIHSSPLSIELISQLEKQTREKIESITENVIKDMARLQGLRPFPIITAGA